MVFCGNSAIKLNIIEIPDSDFLGGHGFLNQFYVISHVSDHLGILINLDFLKGLMAFH